MTAEQLEDVKISIHAPRAGGDDGYAVKLA